MPSTLAPLLPSFCRDLMSIFGSPSFGCAVNQEDEYLTRLKTGKRSLLIFSALVTRHRKHSHKLMPEIINCVLNMVKFTKNSSNDYMPLDFLPLLQVIVGNIGNDENESESSILFQLLSSIMEAGDEKVAVHIPLIVSSIVGLVSKWLTSNLEPWPQCALLLKDNDQILDSLTWLLSLDEMENSMVVKSHAVQELKNIINKDGTCSILERLKPSFFETMVNILRHHGITQQGVNVALHVQLGASSITRHIIMMVEAGLVHELVEIELMAPEKRITDLTLAILFQLCSCANGRAKFMNHEGSIAVVIEY